MAYLVVAECRLFDFASVTLKPPGLFLSRDAPSALLALFWVIPQGGFDVVRELEEVLDL